MNPEETLASWRAEESKFRERLARTTGYARAEQLDGRIGLDTLQGIFAGELPSLPMGDTLGFVPIRIERGRAIFEDAPDSRYYNPLGTTHGGWFTALFGFSNGLRCALDAARRRGIHDSGTQGRHCASSDRTCGNDWCSDQGARVRASRDLSIA